MLGQLEKKNHHLHANNTMNLEALSIVKQQINYFSLTITLALLLQSLNAGNTEDSVHLRQQHMKCLMWAQDF